MKTFTSTSKLHNYLTCEFSAHGIVDDNKNKICRKAQIQLLTDSTFK